MRISLNWLQSLVKHALAPEALAEKLTLAGFEVEEIEDRRTWAEGVVVGRVKERIQHPNADKLSVCQLDLGDGETTQIVCGASNVKADIFVAVATLGTFLPKAGDEGLKIKAAKLRGESSSGMICSLGELGLTKDADGIHIFDEAITGPLSPGMDVRPFLGLEDIVLDLSSTANRADALSMVGIAREVAALTGAELNLPKSDRTFEKTSDALTVQVSESTACPAYIGTVIEGIKIQSSPDWLKAHLQSAGVRPINNVVDVTNYIMLEWGQPLHAFDGDRLRQVAGGDHLTLSVGTATAGETLTTLDGQARTATNQTLFITANGKPVALAGVMGGAETEVHDGTVNLVLEAALFDAAAIRRSGRSQGLRSEASARFERGVNLAELEVATARAIALILELAGGTVKGSAFHDVRPAELTRTIGLRYERVCQVLGYVEEGEDLRDLKTEEIELCLKSLNCVMSAIDGKQTWQVTVPPYRYRDLEREIDLIEEVARRYGYDNFCDTLPDKSEMGYLSLEQSALRRIREALRGVGLTELVQYSLGKPVYPNQVMLSNPLFAEYSALRLDLIDGLIEACQYNLEQGNGSLNGFEIGHLFCQDDEGFLETESLAGVMGGDGSRGRWQRGGKVQPMTWYEAKGLLEAALDRVSLKVEFQPDRRDPRLHPGRSASMWVSGERLGTFGQIHPELGQTKGIPDETYFFEMDVDILLKYLTEGAAMVPVFQAYSTFPASDRDIAFYVPTTTSVAELERAMKKAAGPLLTKIELFDEYKGDRVPEGQRSLAFRLVYRTDRTLKDEDVEPVMQKVRDALVDKFRVDLRS
jgi:phenylalanyl-tRNA synthetase beta chain